MPFPLRLAPGSRGYFQPGSFGSQASGSEVIISEVGRVYLYDTMGRSFRIDDGLNARGPAHGRLWPSRAMYESEMKTAVVLLKLSDRLAKIARTTKGTRPPLDNVLAAATALGINPETLR